MSIVDGECAAAGLVGHRRRHAIRGQIFHRPTAFSCHFLSDAATRSVSLLRSSNLGRGCSSLSHVARLRDWPRGLMGSTGDAAQPAAYSLSKLIPAVGALDSNPRDDIAGVNITGPQPQVQGEVSSSYVRAQLAVLTIERDQDLEAASSISDV